jgi:hypothetical protein
MFGSGRSQGFEGCSRIRQDGGIIAFGVDQPGIAPDTLITNFESLFSRGHVGFGFAGTSG